MKRSKFSRSVIVGCFATSSLIGNSGCSMMQRDYFYDEYGQMHEIDTSKQRTGKFFGNLFMLTPYGILGGLALKIASEDSRKEEVARANQGYLIDRLNKQKPQLIELPYTPNQKQTFHKYSTQPRAFAPYSNNLQSK